MLYGLVTSLSSDSFPEVDLLYKSRLDSISVNNVGNFSKGSYGFFDISPTEYDFAFSDYSFPLYACYLYRNKYLSISLELSNYDLLHSILIYAKDATFVINKYHYLPLVKAGNTLPEKTCLYEYNENWFLAIK
jgi:hypothetical protein